ncbi:MAG: hypothetical protein HC905_06490 [Bacteroidales bacterium]|nr:hypothetical protein [Bacteroidales bacterium]
MEDVNQSYDDSAIILFEEYNNVDLIKELLHCKVYAPLRMFRRKRGRSTDIYDLKGYLVIDIQHGELGPVEEILDYNQNVLLRILKGKKEILIPAQEPLIEKIDSQTKTIYINTPEGLIDMYLE